MYSIHSCIFFQVNKKETIYYKGFDALRQSFLKTYLETNVVRYLEVLENHGFSPQLCHLELGGLIGDRNFLSICFLVLKWDGTTYLQEFLWKSNLKTSINE